MCGGDGLGNWVTTAATSMQTDARRFPMCVVADASRAALMMASSPSTATAAAAAAAAATTTTNHQSQH